MNLLCGKRVLPVCMMLDVNIPYLLLASYSSSREELPASDVSRMIDYIGSSNILPLTNYNIQMRTKTSKLNGIIHGK